MKLVIDNVIKQLETTNTLVNTLKIQLAQLRVKQAKTFLESTELLLEITTLEIRIEELGASNEA